MLRGVFAWENKKRDRKGEANYAQDSELMNLTDRGNRGFQASRALFNLCYEAADPLAVLSLRRTIQDSGTGRGVTAGC